MFRRFIPLALSVLISGTAIAQQQPSPSEQALGGKLMKEINEGLQCNAGVLQLQADLTKANERIKVLEASAPKEEPKKD